MITTREIAEESQISAEQLSNEVVSLNSTAGALTTLIGNKISNNVVQESVSFPIENRETIQRKIAA